MACPALGVTIPTGEPLPKEYKLTVAWMSDGDPSIARTLTVTVQGSGGCWGSAAAPKNAQRAHTARKAGREPASGREGGNHVRESLGDRMPVPVKICAIKPIHFLLPAANCTPLGRFRFR